MAVKQLYFALWAEDIGQYLHTGYNANYLSEVESALRDYISVDEADNENYSNSSLMEIIRMTGLSLDYSKSEFLFQDEYF
jgi:hypothetical protein